MNARLEWTRHAALYFFSLSLTFCRLEQMYETKRQELLNKHEEELAVIHGSDSVIQESSDKMEAKKEGDETEQDKVVESDLKSKKLEKARKKREKERQMELEREREIQLELENAGPLPREVEAAQIQKHLPDGYTIQAVAADGHCLYRAVAAQLNRNNSSTPPYNYASVRNTVADSLLQHAEDLSAFCDYSDEVPDFETYVHRVRSSADWGGHVELRALALALQRPVWVYSASSAEPLKIEPASKVPEGDSSSSPILLSYHLQYYSLGEHYNEIVVEIP